MIWRGVAPGQVRVRPSDGTQWRVTDVFIESRLDVPMCLLREATSPGEGGVRMIRRSAATVRGWEEPR